ncbi:hypothetical protein BDQ94DRAFT_53157 [Aspergillus welwitschiae]|uniref:Uncharacterized protein n=1 Tax=Aspergillus welwitschiae TaxID=1341132 RepID=A0A3F3PY83_9EURO|nr:hypothetical protein BDQ94DRAFT_53157 [Aspergillus welwitschiae]RDH31914.1 hypothetical protein BDQ94DRAFT_53157 [Aspergillus welwitschiae]
MAQSQSRARFRVPPVPVCRWNFGNNEDDPVGNSVLRSRTSAPFFLGIHADAGGHSTTQRPVFRADVGGSDMIGNHAVIYTHLLRQMICLFIAGNSAVRARA